MTSADQMRRHPRPATIGAGYLHHCIPGHQKYFERLMELDARVDMVEYLAAHFATDPDYLGEVNASTAGLPSTLHSYEYMLGSVDDPDPETVRRLQRMAEVSNCLWIGEHVGMVGTRDTYTGTFMQPMGTDEQTQVFIDNLRAANEQSSVPLIIENQPMLFNQIGPRSVCQQVADIAVGADAGILLSLSNLVISDDYHPVDWESELSRIPLDRVWQVHLPLPNEKELAEPEYARFRRNEKWHFSTLERLFKEKDFRPSVVILEVEASGTPSRPAPERTKERLDWVRELMAPQFEAEEKAR
ncbi:DUF692 domain-containing protein [Streptomyces sp. SCA3-4]|uniref:multinuclear nonheme iron-dependent oxidase n=1 Tax=Streptomyces sichuanensis TaxID=2871810 RepID=UPI001CE32156|nr:DUF692 family multinuclear iron-containing protein [Streptomyces sichuanensis]MCA6092191.1 DUF692 domain-containing protein [Streptomyces sichuanensis]